MEAKALRCLNAASTFEIVPNTMDEVCDAVASQELQFTAPERYIDDHRAARDFVGHLIHSLSTPIGLPEQSVERDAQRLLHAHVGLGHLTGLQPAASMRNALMVIEAHCGLKLQALRNVLQEVA